MGSYFSKNKTRILKSKVDHKNQYFFKYDTDLEQAQLNICKNQAVKFARKHGEIAIDRYNFYNEMTKEIDFQARINALEYFKEKIIYDFNI